LILPPVIQRFATKFELYAETLVTGDKELLDLRKIEDLTVVSPRELWNQLAGLDPGSRK